MQCKKFVPLLPDPAALKDQQPPKRPEDHREDAQESRADLVYASQQAHGSTGPEGGSPPALPFGGLPLYHPSSSISYHDWLRADHGPHSHHSDAQPAPAYQRSTQQVMYPGYASAYEAAASYVFLRPVPEVNAYRSVRDVAPNQLQQTQRRARDLRRQALESSLPPQGQMDAHVRGRLSPSPQHDVGSEANGLSSPVAKTRGVKIVHSCDPADAEMVTRFKLGRVNDGSSLTGKVKVPKRDATVEEMWRCNKLRCKTCLSTQSESDLRASVATSHGLTGVPLKRSKTVPVEQSGIGSKLQLPGDGGVDYNHPPTDNRIVHRHNQLHQAQALGSVGRPIDVEQVNEFGFAAPREPSAYGSRLHGQPRSTATTDPMYNSPVTAGQQLNSEPNRTDTGAAYTPY
ncbi:hypothetical protein LTR36_002647 [Oleoguttula mirabilis]|uniref:Uncharacterized protein n=1 Tax=Oleoguttula mirabilis TaxID=1507867 RepID=A0AAV9JKI9_9PEZI|nr:hypothetical protein LTR36_002647 [Oleoguttula mirabilis]